MPTFNRRRFVAAAIEYFRRQDWPHKELVVVDDGEDCVRDLVPDDPAIRYVRLRDRATIGAKRNIACEHARGEVIAHWDDDDWQAARRLRLQADTLLSNAADVCGITRLLFCNVEEGRAFEFTYAGGPPWVGGSSMMYRRAAWARAPFPECNVGEDNRFVAAQPRERVLVMRDGTFHVGRIHTANVTPKRPDSPSWRAIPLERIREAIAADWDGFVRPEAFACPATARPSGRRAEPLVSCIMPTANRRAFVPLALEHFRAQDYANKELIVVDCGDDPV